MRQAAQAAIPFGGDDDPVALLKATLSAKKRNRLPPSDFAGPSGTYPIQDVSHARNALARAAQQKKAGNLTASAYDAIVAKVKKRYPSIDVSAGNGKAWAPVLRLKGAPPAGLLASMPGLGYQTKALQTEFEVKDAADGKGAEVTHYVNTFDHRDLDGDVTVKGAFALSIRDDLAMIKALRDHDKLSLVGVPRHMEEDQKGCLTVTRFGSSEKSRNTLADIKDGLLTHCSIGFFPRPGGVEYGDFRGQRSQFLKSLRLKEYSFVAFPVDVQAAVVGVKSLDDISSLLWQLPRAIQWLCSPEAFAELAEETVLQAIEMFEDAADQLRVVAGLPPEPDEAGETPEEPDDQGAPEPPADLAEVQALAGAVSKLVGLRQMSPSL